MFVTINQTYNIVIYYCIFIMEPFTWLAAFVLPKGINLNSRLDNIVDV